MSTEQKKEIVKIGISISPGVAICPAFVYRVLKYQDIKQDSQISDQEVTKQIKKLSFAISHAKATVNMQRNRMIGKTKKYHLGIFEFQTYLLEDSSFIEKIKTAISEQRMTAYQAVIEVTNDLAQKMKQTFEDIKDVGNLICSFLSDEETYLTAIPENKPFIFVSDILTPSIVSFLVNSEVQGVITELGGKTSHAVILSESLRVPVVVNTPGITVEVQNEDIIGMDGDCGKIVVNPTPRRLKAFERLQKWHNRYTRRIKRDAHKQARTEDKYKIKIWANIELVSELDYVIDSGAEGIGLYRTEFLFLENPHKSPDINEQYQIYREVVTGMDGRPVTFRILDIGADKIPYFINGKKVDWVEEPNPALGYRGVRLLRGHQDKIIIPQLKAILKASAYGPVKIMLPMVSLVEEAMDFKLLMEEAVKSLGSEAPRRKPPLGIMLETPSSVLLIDKFAKYVDFFSIGTNDLTQYVLAVDRNNAQVAYMWDHYHPAVLKLVSDSIIYARENKKLISICGEAASDPYLAALFIGLGANILSISPAKVAELKHYIRQWNQQQLKEIAAEVINYQSAQEVRTFLKRKVKVGIL